MLVRQSCNAPSCTNRMAHPRVWCPGWCSTSREGVSVITVIILITLPQLSSTVTRRQTCTIQYPTPVSANSEYLRPSHTTIEMGGRWWNIETLKHVQTSIMIQILMEITIHSLCHHLSHVLTSCKHKSNLSSLKYCKYFRIEFGSFSAESRPTCTYWNCRKLE